MQTNESRLRRISARTAQLWKERCRRRQHTLTAVSLTLCLLAICGMGRWFSTLESVPAAPVGTALGVASLLTDQPALSYILMGLLCFLLGISITVLLFRLRRFLRRRRQEDDTHEL